MDSQALQQVIQKFDRKQISILSTAVLTVATAWFIRRTIKKSKEFKTGGSREIPTPDGQYFYLGKKVCLLIINILSNSIV